MKRSDVLKPSQVARIYGCDPKTATRWICEGRLAAFKTPGGHWLVRVGTVRDALIAGGVTAAEADGMIAAALRGQSAGGS